MAEHTYKPGDIVSVAARVYETGMGDLAIRRVDGFVIRPSPQRRWPDFWTVEDQSSLLRVVKAAAELFVPPDDTPARSWEELTMLEARVRTAIAALPPHLVDRLAEGE